jgi:hypothetical protein
MAVAAPSLSTRASNVVRLAEQRANDRGVGVGAAQVNARPAPRWPASVCPGRVGVHDLLVQRQRWDAVDVELLGGLELSRW